MGVIILDIWNLCNWPILLAAWLLPFILGALFSWGLLSKYRKNIAQLKKEKSDLQGQIADLNSAATDNNQKTNNIQSELDLMRGELRTISANNQQLKKKLKASEAKQISTSTTSLKGSQKDVLEKIYQLSVSDAKILESNGIDSFEKLFNTDKNKISDMFDLVGQSVTLKKIKRWQNQAQLASNNLWDAFDELTSTFKKQDS